ncbi:DNA starvation/stationary phase protection protein [bacterium]|nr:MAG: DNA starvation/stationary phase protection protein [bacterium]
MSDQTIVQELQKFQADATVYYQKLRHYHWHVTGKQFFALHAKFEGYYDHWAELVDEIAERILTIGGKALPTLKEILAKAELKEDPEFPKAEEMVLRITKDLEHIVKEARRIKAIAEEHGDAGTVNMMDELCDVEYKNLWMLHSFLKG